ncbi:hypothetical protein ACF073_21885 [Streptomyces sp. NPDC015171]|uniref:hypothetical protein n=1 Tax=Streptomyces sp. NPDC015171 TaxID=3364945 RepID=UPI0036F589CB
MIKLISKRVFGAAAAVTMAATALVGAGAGSAGAAERAHCDSAERDMWSEAPGIDVFARGCSIPDQDHRWYRIEIDTLVQKYYKTEYVTGRADRTKTVHDRTVRCLGHLSEKNTVHWFGCVPH